MNTETKYVRIIRSGGEYDWTNDHVGCTYPVIEYAKSLYQVESGNKKGHLIDKSDCEGAPITPQPQPEQDQDMEALARAYADRVQHKGSTRLGTWEGAKEDFLEGYSKATAAAFDRGFKQATKHQEQTGYTITEEQIEELYGMGMEGYSESISYKIEEWFPEVFKPKPTYTPGQRFIVEEEELMLIRLHGRWMLLNVNTGNEDKRDMVCEIGRDHIDAAELLYLTKGSMFHLIE